MTQFNDIPEVLELADAPAPNAIAEAAAESAGTDIALLPPKQRAVRLFNSDKTRKDLKKLAAESADITEIKNADGRAQVHAMAMRLQKARTGIEKTGKGARDDANAFNKAVLEEQRDLIAITEPEETRVFKLRDDWDAEQKRLADERERKERERKATIDATIANIRNLPVELVNASADEIQVELDAIEELVREGFTALDEFAEVGMAAARHVRQTLETMQAPARAREQMAAQLAEQARVFEEQKAAMAAQLAALEQQKAELAAQLAAAQAPAELEQQATYGGPNPDYNPDAAPAGWDKIEGDTPITPEVHARESRITLDNGAGELRAESGAVLATRRGGGRMAPLDWGTIGERNPNVVVNGGVDTDRDGDTLVLPEGFTDAGLARVAAAVATHSAPLELWVVLEDGEPIVSKLNEDEARGEALQAINMNPQHTYSIAQYLLASEHAA